jgi:hypothetical protein
LSGENSDLAGRQLSCYRRERREPRAAPRALSHFDQQRTPNYAGATKPYEDVIFSPNGHKSTINADKRSCRFARATASQLYETPYWLYLAAENHLYDWLVGKMTANIFFP